MLTVCSNYRGPDRGARVGDGAPALGGAAGRLVPASGLGRRGRAGAPRLGVPASGREQCPVSSRWRQGRAWALRSGSWGSAAGRGASTGEVPVMGSP
jgi:hypothetical protein